MSEKELDRLNYYNGKRLLASDLKLEQEYHIRVRRWLNKSLYAAGIARGLEVREVPGAPTVIVSPGLALDSEGREIILLDEARVDVLGLASKSPCGWQPGDGSYLTIQYDEEVIAEESDGCCAPMPGGSRNGSSVAWGGPARVRAEPVLQWTDVLPTEGSGQIVLAQVSLKTGCGSVQSVDASVRRYIGAASAAKVRQYALEGVRDLDPDNPQRIYFHVRGRQPSAVTLYLKAERLPTLYYTELGRHDHSLSVTAGVETSTPIYDAANPTKYDYSPTLGTLSVDSESSHEHHDFQAAFNGGHSTDNERHIGLGGGGLGGWEVPVYNNILPVISAATRRIDGLPPGQHGSPFTAKIAGATSHSHTLSGSLGPIHVTDDHKHTVNPSASMGDAGVTQPPFATDPSYAAKSDSPITFIDDLKISVDGRDQTGKIQEQLHAAFPAESWAKLGDGTATHPLADKTKESRPMKLDFLPHVFFGDGEHVIELSVVDVTGKRNGGRINYNLYVE